MTDKLLTIDDLIERVPGTDRAYWAHLRYIGAGPAFIKTSSRNILYAEPTFNAWLKSLERTISSRKAVHTETRE